MIETKLWIVISIIFIYYSNKIGENINLSVDFTKESTDANLYNLIFNAQLFEGADSRKDINTNIKFEICLNCNSVYFWVNNESTKQGIKCSNIKNENNSCRINETDQHEFIWNNRNLKYSDSELFVRLIDDKIDVSNKLQAKGIVVKSEDWPFKDYGVLGLSPLGEFSNYIKSTYDSFSLMPLILLDKVFSFQLIANPKYSENNIVANLPIDPKTDFWSSKGSVKIVEKFDTIDKDICFTTQLDEFIAIKDSENLCNEIIKIGCKVDDPKKCTSDKFDSTKIPLLKIIFGDKEFVFNADSYMKKVESEEEKQQKGELICLIGDISKINKNNICNENSELAVGKRFMMTFPTIFKYNKEGSNNIIILKKDDGASNLLIFTIIGIILIIVVIGAIIAFVVNRKVKEDEAYYNEYSEAESI